MSYDVLFFQVCFYKKFKKCVILKLLYKVYKFILKYNFILSKNNKIIFLYTCRGMCGIGVEEGGCLCNKKWVSILQYLI